MFNTESKKGEMVVNRRGTGVSFCLIAALLYAAKYISAAIFGSNISSWDADLFSHMIDYMGGGLPLFSKLALIIGIAYLVWAEIEENLLNSKQTKHIKEWLISKKIKIKL